MERLDEKIAALERVRRMEQKGEDKENTDNDQLLLSVEEIREKIQTGSIFLPEKGELFFETVICFDEKIPLIFLDKFYTNCQETEDAIMMVHNEKNVGQTLIHLPAEMERLDMEEWGYQIKQGMKANGFYADIIKKKPLGNLDYITYRVPSKKGWIYNISYRIHKVDWRVIGGCNCMDQDRDTYGRLLEAMIQEMAQQL